MPFPSVGDTTVTNLTVIGVRLVGVENSAEVAIDGGLAAQSQKASGIPNTSQSQINRLLNWDGPPSANCCLYTYLGCGPSPPGCQ